MEEAPTRRVTAMSSLNEISTDHLGDRVVEKWGGGTPLVSRLMDRYLETTLTVFRYLGYLLHDL
jgi:hypothetical protein